VLGADDLVPWLGDDLDLAAANETALSVASGPTPAIEALAGRLAADGIEGRVLHTSHAFHSRMMEPMLDEFADVVAGVERHEPTVPYVSNVTGDWVTPAEATDPGYWARQVRSPVRWADGLARVLGDPQRVLIEVGPGQTLCTFARRHPDRTPAQPVVPSLRHPNEGRADPAFLLESVARLWLAGLPVRWAGLHEGDPRRRVHLPGYPLDRQRYWVEEPGAGRTGPVVVEKEPDMADWFYVPSWDYALAPGEGVAEPDGAPAGGTRWLVFDDGSPVGRAVVSDIEARGDPVTVVEAGSVFAKVDDTHYVIDATRRAHYDDLVAALAAGDGPPHHVLHLWSVGPPDGDWSELPGLEWHEQNGFYSVLYLAQALVAGQVHDAVHLVVASNDMHLVTGEEWLCPAKSLLLGVCKSVSQEYPHLVCRSVDVELPRDGDGVGDPAECARQLVAEFADPDLAPVVAYRHGQRWLQTFEPLPLDEETDPISMLRWQGVYLITGGLGNIGLALAARLATSVCARLVLVGRSGFLPRGEWDDWLWSHEWEDPTSEKIRTLQFIEEQGSEVLILAADVADLADMRWVLDETYAAYGRLDGVIHGAGHVTPSGFFGIDEAEPERCEAQLRPKVQGVATLADVLYDAGPDFVMLVSSLSSVLAGLGYVAYAAANQFMDACAHKYSQATGICWVSVNWDSWDFSDPRWADPPPTQLALFAEEGAEAFARILSAAMLPQVVVSVGDLAGRMDQWTSLTSLRRAGSESGGGQGERLYARPDLAVPYVAPRTPVETAIVEVWQDGLGIGQIGVYDNFFADLGGSSLLATQLIARLRDRFHAELPLRRFFDGPTVAELADLVVADTGAAAGELVEAAGS